MWKCTECGHENRCHDVPQYELSEEELKDIKEVAKMFGDDGIEAEFTIAPESVVCAKCLTEFEVDHQEEI